MQRTTVLLTANEKKALTEEAKTTGQTQSEIIRMCIDERLLQRNFDLKRVK
jgi:Ribbon-helix-helix protein, copG family